MNIPGIKLIEVMVLQMRACNPLHYFISEMKAQSGFMRYNTVYQRILRRRERDVKIIRWLKYTYTVKQLTDGDIVELLKPYLNRHGIQLSPDYMGHLILVSTGERMVDHYHPGLFKEWRFYN